MSRYLKKEENLNLSDYAFAVYASSTFSFYRDGETYYMHDSSSAEFQPVGNLERIGDIDDVDTFLCEVGL